MSAIINAFQLFPASISDPENIDTYQISRALPQNSLFLFRNEINLQARNMLLKDQEWN